ncbi:MAG: 30S ribosomal protein S15 [Bdellovibrionales bacterium]|nr:30S ribosomal protein S15 [Bdellovibrionales bacterium]
MSISRDEKKKVIAGHRVHENDSGSPEVQVALLTTRINHLTDHFKKHVKDFHSRRGLLKLVGQRRSLLTYLKREAPTRYNKLIADLGLRK